MMLKISSPLIPHIFASTRPPSPSSLPMAMSFSMEKLMAIGREEGDGGLVDAKICGIKGDDIFSIIYTSGTTGRPKGVMISHANLLSNILASLKSIIVRPDALSLSFLPLSHIFERMVHRLIIHQGASIAYSKGFAYVGADIALFKPPLMAGVPFFFEKKIVFMGLQRRQKEICRRRRFLFLKAGAQSCAEKA